MDEIRGQRGVFVGDSAGGSETLSFFSSGSSIPAGGWWPPVTEVHFLGSLAAMHGPSLFQLAGGGWKLPCLSWAWPSGKQCSLLPFPLPAACRVDNHMDGAVGAAVTVLAHAGKCDVETIWAKKYKELSSTTLWRSHVSPGPCCAWRRNELLV